jgi:DNA-binding transcriptional MerR regulator
MESGRGYTVGEVASLAHVSVRTLHHYDAIGLLTPSDRTASGYRLYRHWDLEQLQHILLYRELDFPLDAIGRLMLDPTFDRRAALAAHRDQLAGRAQHLTRIVAAIDAALDALTKGEPMNDTDMFEVFGDFDPTAHEPEVMERWGKTDAYAESARRTTRCSGCRPAARWVGRGSRRYPTRSGQQPIDKSPSCRSGFP